MLKIQTILTKTIHYISAGCKNAMYPKLNKIILIRQINNSYENEILDFD